MTDEEIVRRISAALEKTVKKSVPITMDTDLIGDGILDSLDGMVFLLEIEQAFGKGFPERVDLVEEGYYKIRKLVEHLK